MKNAAVVEQPILPPVTDEMQRATDAVGSASLVVPESRGATMFERLAADPNVPVDKLERLIALQERMEANGARSAFNAAFAAMAPNLPVIDEKGQIKGRDEKVRSRYAKLEDIQAAIKPVLSEFGFAIRHRTEWPEGRDGLIRIVGILTHRDGHAEESTFEAPMDKSDFRTDVQSQGSTISYGRRYTTIDLLNIETRGHDDDGNKAGRPQPPDGYDDFKVALSKAADKGLSAVESLFKAADVKLRNYLTNHDAIDYAKIRTRARTGKAAGE